MYFFETYLWIYEYLGLYSYIWYKVYGVIDSPSNGLDFAVCIFPLFSDDFKCTPTTNWLWNPSVAQKPPEFCRSGKSNLDFGYVTCDRVELFPWIPMVSFSSFSLISLWSLLAPLHTVSLVLCDIPYIKLNPSTGFHKKSTLNTLSLWWRLTLLNTASLCLDHSLHHHPLFFWGTSKAFLPLLHSCVALSHIETCQVVTFHTMHSSRMAFTK